ncbi:hypothetical protein [Saccharopolyspora gloriosae]|uniref:hypothetical protein n=1 Tax=Saccharopolyspora gloriosae TaxID=455344 RepID=UPI001FB608F6|nr:hypothetical protein [Saccharopolyspora gloriosae]
MHRTGLRYSFAIPQGSWRKHPVRRRGSGLGIGFAASAVDEHSGIDGIRTRGRPGERGAR